MTPQSKLSAKGKTKTFWLLFVAAHNIRSSKTVLICSTDLMNALDVNKLSNKRDLKCKDLFNMVLQFKDEKSFKQPKNMESRSQELPINIKLS